MRAVLYVAVAGATFLVAVYGFPAAGGGGPAMKHVDVHVWEWCVPCGQFAVSNCALCRSTHERLHHRKRGRRLRKAQGAA